MKHLPENERRVLLNQETGLIAWPELQVHFARGVLIYVNQSLDLVTVADKFILDDKSILQPWYDDKLIQPTPAELASRWAEEKISLWAIVVAPWVLVQEQQKDSRE